MSYQGIMKRKRRNVVTIWGNYFSLMIEVSQVMNVYTNLVTWSVDVFQYYITLKLHNSQTHLYNKICTNYKYVIPVYYIVMHQNENDLLRARDSINLRNMARVRLYLMENNLTSKLSFYWCLQWVLQKCHFRIHHSGENRSLPHKTLRGVFFRYSWRGLLCNTCHLQQFFGFSMWLFLANGSVVLSWCFRFHHVPMWGQFLRRFKSDQTFSEIFRFTK